jgi:hypothetical protein
MCRTCRHVSSWPKIHKFTIQRTSKKCFPARIFRNPLRDFLTAIGGQLERLELNHLENIDKQLIVQVVLHRWFITGAVRSSFLRIRPIKQLPY